jgi:DNA replication protein DnaC
MTNGPNLFRSWLAWRNFFKEEKINLFTLTGVEHPTRMLFIQKERARRGIALSDVCPVCDGWEQTMLNGEPVYCMCRVLGWETELRMTQDDLFHVPNKTKIEDLKVYGDIQAKMRLTQFLKDLNTWVKDPTMWLTISGPVGTGKSHALKALANIFWPLALYVPATEFESRIFSWMSEGLLEENLQIVTKAPILLYDDMGADYGGKFAEAKLRGVIDWRYSHAKDHITVVTTNIPLQVLIGNAGANDRIASRILDNAIAQRIDLSKVPDYRLTVGR